MRHYPESVQRLIGRWIGTAVRFAGA